MKRIAVIGTGHMGAPIARALHQAGMEVIVANRTVAKAEAVASGCEGMQVALDAPAASREADVVVLAVKPHLLLEVMAQCITVNPGAAYVSLAPGISLRELEERGATLALRLMPNVAIAQGEGMSFICHNEAAASVATELVQTLGATGSVAIVEERLFEPAMQVTSCGIAYALRYVRAGAEAAVALGIRPDDATAYIAQTLRGTAALLEAHPGVNPEALIDTVTTPGGTTIRGLLAMERAGFSAAVAAGLLS
ncbi:MAG: NAD(P)-binding domain-containing protein [Muribaculaceae bacterium]|nr:NAD(P)-binding domain-containing protein [Muribaculaceae bacterium]